MKSYNPVYLQNQDLSGDITGPAVSMLEATKISFQVYVTLDGTPSGTLYIQTSNDGATWHNLGTDAWDGTSTVYLVEAQTVYAMMARLKYTSTSGGSGDTLSANVAVTAEV